MVLDPETIIAAAALSEVGKGVVKGLSQLGRKWITELFGDTKGPAVAKAESNMAAFLIQLATRIGRLEQAAADSAALEARLRDAQADPDVLVTTKLAVLAAARSSDSTKRDLLVEVVTRRIASASESAEAIAANVAAEAVPRMNAADLDTVGLLALVAGVRPSILPPDSPPPDKPDNAPLVGIGRWYWAATQELIAGLSTGHDRLLHLASIGLCSIHLGLRRDLFDELRRGIPSCQGLAEGRQIVEINRFLTFFDAGRNLRRAWLQGMQEALLTPAGILIGRTVVDIRLPTDLPNRRWVSDASALREGLARSSPWDGHTLNRRFVELLDQELAKRVTEVKRAQGRL